jgi:hypothetical protein
MARFLATPSQRRNIGASALRQLSVENEAALISPSF